MSVYVSDNDNKSKEPDRDDLKAGLATLGLCVVAAVVVFFFVISHG